MVTFVQRMQYVKTYEMDFYAAVCLVTIKNQMEDCALKVGVPF